jgi:hypothetical protein
MVEIEASETTRGRGDEIAVIVGGGPPAGLMSAAVEKGLVDAELARLGGTSGQHAFAANAIAKLPLVLDDQDMRARAIARLDPASPPPTTTRS